MHGEHKNGLLDLAADPREKVKKEIENRETFSYRYKREWYNVRS